VPESPFRPWQLPPRRPESAPPDAAGSAEPPAAGRSPYLKPAPGQGAPAASIPDLPAVGRRIPLGVVAGLTVAVIALIALAAVLITPRLQAVIERERAARARQAASPGGRTTQSLPGVVVPTALPPAYERLAPGPTSVGITYFAGASREGDDAHLADFMTRAVASRLRQARDRFGRPVVARFVETDAGSYTYALTGTIGRENEQVRSRVRVTASDGEVVWQDELVRPLVALESVAGEATARVAARLAVRLSADRGRPAPAVGVADPDSAEAYNRRLRGRYLRGRYDAASLEAAAEAYIGAATLDSGSAAVHADVAVTFARLVRWNGPRPAYFARGRAAVARALALDSASGLAWAARAALAAQDVTPAATSASLAQASADARRALALAPSVPEAQRAMSLVQLRTGNVGAAEATLRRLLGRHPDDVDAMVEIGAIAYRAGRWRETRVLADRAVAADPKAIPAYALRALTRLKYDGELRAAFADAETATQLGRPVWGDAVRAQIQAAARDRDGANATVERLTERIAASGPLSAWDEQFVRGAVDVAGGRVRRRPMLRPDSPARQPAGR
jgi:tetratricopeptide (TPR) repeat protein